MDDLPAYIKPVVITTVFALLLLCETYAPMFMERKHRLRHDAVNIGMGLINALATALLLASAIHFITSWSAENGIGLLHMISFPANWTWAQWLIGLLLFDLWMYAWHVILHKVPIFWRFHAVHHSDMEMDASSAMRFHLGEIVLSTAARIVVLPVIGLSFEQLLLYELILQPVILLHHSNVRLPAMLDRCLRWVIVTPSIHWVHHSNRRAETDSNYGSVLNWWDRIFRTLRNRSPDEITFGLESTGTKESNQLSAMLKQPFRVKSEASGADDS